MITYLLAVGGSDSKIRLAVAESRIEVLGAIGIATILYSGVAGLLSHWHIDLLRRNGVETLSTRLWFVGIARIAAIFSISLLGLWVTWTL
jgi:hypothetical protein